MTQTITVIDAFGAKQSVPILPGTGLQTHANSLPVTPSGVPAAPMALNTAYDFTQYGALRVQADSLSGGDSIAFSGSVAQAGTTYPFQQILNTQTGAVTATITTSGVYVVLFAGGFWITATKTGSASTPVLTSSASQ
jgi:hypothetical protein